jgi:hypothetical protein
MATLCGFAFWKGIASKIARSTLTKENLGENLGEKTWGTFRVLLFGDIFLAFRVARDENLIISRTGRAFVGGYCYHALSRGKGKKVSGPEKQAITSLGTMFGGT